MTSTVQWHIRRLIEEPRANPPRTVAKLFKASAAP